MRLSRLAEDLGLQKSAVHRILRTLCEAGLARQDPDTGLYGPTLRVWELGSAVVAALPVKQAATTVLHELHRTTGETVSLSVLDGDDVVYLDKVTSPRPAGFTTRVGSRIPAPLTVGGRAMLADEDDPAAVLDRVLDRLGPDAFDRDQALRDVARVRRQGYLVGRGRRGRGIVGIAAAVPGRGGRAAAGLTVSAPVARVDAAGREHIVSALLAATAALGDAVGQL